MRNRRRDAIAGKMPKPMTAIHFKADAKLMWAFECEKHDAHMMVSARRDDMALSPEELARAICARDPAGFQRVGVFIDKHGRCPYEMVLVEIEPVGEA